MIFKVGSVINGQNNRQLKIMGMPNTNISLILKIENGKAILAIVWACLFLLNNKAIANGMLQPAPPICENKLEKFSIEMFEKTIFCENELLTNKSKILVP